MIRIMLIVDICLLRTALAKALPREDDLTVVAEKTSADLSPELARRVDADVFVVDLDTPKGSVVDAIDTVAGERPDCGVVVLTNVAVSAALRHALGRGVGACLRKNCHIEELEDAVRRVAAGERFIEPAIAVSMVNGPPNPLTPREGDVLRLAAAGMSVREISAVLFLTPGTVRTYLSTIMHKLDAHSRLDAIRIATEANWL
ncbi:response regulator transcription factor [Actinoplanes sp. NPDC051411]|jgi:two-component system response regulator DesR|uniref:response regulator transcription factor n=1 Tax=Actinoplanes sp. NPDC051411 TaxID=3155522 RepID=UPI003444C0A4